MVSQSRRYPLAGQSVQYPELSGQLLDLPGGQEIGSGLWELRRGRDGRQGCIGHESYGNSWLGRAAFSGAGRCPPQLGGDIADITIFIIFNQAVALSAAPTRFILPTFSVLLVRYPKPVAVGFPTRALAAPRARQCRQELRRRHQASP